VLLSASRGGARLDGRLLFGVAVLHAAFIAAACLSFAPQTPAPTQDTVAVLFAPRAEATAQTHAATAPPAPVEHAVSLPAPQPALQPAITVPAHAPLPARHVPLDAVKTRPRAAAPRAVQQTQNEGSAGAAHAVPAPAPSPPTPQMSAAQSGEAPRLLASWEASIRQAVQDATVYPASARLHRRAGRVRVQFDYDHGAVAQASVVQTSLFAPLDAAALSAVNRAAIPPPPAAIGPQRRTMLVWVQFTLVADE
jgi:protein TonB